jgi:hypothetical protein
MYLESYVTVAPDVIVLPEILPPLLPPPSPASLQEANAKVSERISSVMVMDLPGRIRGGGGRSDFACYVSFLRSWLFPFVICFANDVEVWLRQTSLFFSVWSFAKQKLLAICLYNVCGKLRRCLLVPTVRAYNEPITGARTTYAHSYNSTRW